MGVKQAISALLVVILTGLPGSGSLCAVVCGASDVPGPDESSHHQHAPSPDGHGHRHAASDAPAAVNAPTFDDASRHDCRAHDLAEQSALGATVARADGDGAAITDVVLVLPSATGRLSTPVPDSARRPPGPAPPRFVLRV